jgi:hypothetical protein
MSSGNHVHSEEITVPMERVYWISMVLLPVVIALFLAPYLFIWFGSFGTRINEFVQAVFSKGGFMVLAPYIAKGIVALVVGVLLHEALHGLGWLPFTKHGFKSLSFGFKMPEMAPYAHCREALPVYGYRIGILLPALVLGIAPALKGLITGSFTWLLYGIFFTWSASGDFIMFWLIRNLKAKTRVIDHPKKLGCIILD